MAIQILSFPNCLCLFMVLAVMLHIFTRDATTRVVLDTEDVSEVVYCKFPQTHNQEETERCSSIQSLFFLLANGCSYQKHSREEVKNGSVEEDEYDLQERPVMEESNYEGNMGMEDADGRDEKVAKKEDDEISSSLLVDSFVICLLVFSASVSLMEWYKERNRNAEKQAGGDGLSPGEGENAAATTNRRFSLADLTVNRHIRRKDSPQHHQIVRQGSTGAVGKSGSKPPPLIRRSSFPAQFPEVRPRQAPQRQQSHPGVPPSRRMSVDLAEDDSSPDRRRVRIIRRH